MATKSILITGAGGYLGSQMVNHFAELVKKKKLQAKIVAIDLRETPVDQHRKGVVYQSCDIRSKEVSELIKKYKTDTVYHLAAIIPNRKISRETEYSVDVDGTNNVLEACLQNKVKRFITTSSGAAYGYHPENVNWLTEVDPIRGNYEFPYSYHKRLVEEKLAQLRKSHPQMQQFIFRVGTILGVTTRNPITNLFDKKTITGIKGATNAFVFIWDQDLVAILIKALSSNKPGIYNVAGTGAVTMKEIANYQKKPYKEIPASLVKFVLAIGHFFKLSQYGPEQVKFLQYRPMLSNEKLTKEFGYKCQKNSLETFDFFMKNRKQG